MNQNMKRLPYGINDFEAVIEQINIMWIRRCICLCWKTNQATSSSFVHVVW